MQNRLLGAGTILGVLMLAAWPGPAAAFDCAKAATATEKAICANAALKLADDRMAAAYSALSKTLDDPARAQLLVAQRTWLKKREECGDDWRGPATCILERTRDHADYLSGTLPPGTVSGPQPQLVPFMLQQAGDKTRFEVDYRLVTFADPRDPGEQAFNAEIRKLADDAPMEPLAADEEMFGQHASGLTARITLVTPKIIAARLESYDYTGGAHGMGGTSALNIDRGSGKTLSFDALFDASARDALFALCREAVLFAKRERLQEYDYKPEEDGNYSDDYLRQGLTELGQWVLEPGKATVVFNAYAVGSYAEGQYECEFDADTLSGLSKGALDLR